MISVKSTKKSVFASSHLTEGPQESRVGHRDDGEGHDKAKKKVYDDVGHVSSIPAVPVWSTGHLDAFQLITSPTKQRRSIPHKWPHPGQHHSSNCMPGGEHRWCVTCCWNNQDVLYFCVMLLSEILMIPTWSGTGQHPWDSTPLSSVQQKWLLSCTDLLYLAEKKDLVKTWNVICEKVCCHWPLQIQWCSVPPKEWFPL